MPLDHLVMPVADLDVARSRLSSLGFTVAPDGIHPFGTANCCLYFADGTFIEPLAVADPGKAAQAIRAGNVFVARDALFRSSAGEEGLSAVVLSTDDAAADKARFEDMGASIGEMLTFSREVANPGGQRDTATFMLAFAGEPSTDDAFAFSCERVNAPNVDRSALQNHANGVRGIATLSISSAAARYADLLRNAAQVEPNAPFRLGHTAVEIEAGPPDGHTLCAIGFEVASLPALTERLETSRVTFDAAAGVVSVPPAPGQGVAFTFRESIR